MEEQEIRSMSLADVAKYMDEQKQLGKERKHTQAEIAEIRGVNIRTLARQTETFREKRERKGTMTKKVNTGEIQESTNDSHESTQVNTDFTEYEIKVLKKLVQERKSDIKLFQEFQIYRELEKVPIDGDGVRSAYTMSKETTEKMKTFAKVRRIPLQNLAELAFIKLLEEYDK